MNAPLNHLLARKGTVVTRLKSLQRRRRRFIARVLGTLIVLVILAVLMLSASAGTADPLGRVTEFSTGLPAGSRPEWIAAGRDGNLWFTDADDAIGRIGSGAPPALEAPASVSGARVNGSAEACDTLSSSWAGYAPSALLYPFDGYSWLRDRTAIAGQTAPRHISTASRHISTASRHISTASRHISTAGDAGPRLACRVTVSYPLPFSVTATSAAITVQPAAPPPPTPALSALNITPRMFTLTGRRVGGRCQASSHTDRRDRRCIPRVAVTVRFTRAVKATVTFAIERTLPGRLTRGRCTVPARDDRRHRPCTRTVMLRGSTVISGDAGREWGRDRRCCRK